nr:hypothetical protein CFP56_58203 [Quercus suber]
MVLYNSPFVRMADEGSSGGWWVVQKAHARRPVPGRMECYIRRVVRDLNPISGEGRTGDCGSERGRGGHDDAAAAAVPAAEKRRAGSRSWPHLAPVTMAPVRKTRRGAVWPTCFASRARVWKGWAGVDADDLEVHWRGRLQAGQVAGYIQYWTAQDLGCPAAVDGREPGKGSWACETRRERFWLPAAAGLERRPVMIRRETRDRRRGRGKKPSASPGIRWLTGRDER